MKVQDWINATDYVDEYRIAERDNPFSLRCFTHFSAVAARGEEELDHAKIIVEEDGEWIIAEIYVK